MSIFLRLHPFTFEICCHRNIQLIKIQLSDAPLKSKTPLCVRDARTRAFRVMSILFNEYVFVPNKKRKHFAYLFYLRCSDCGKSIACTNYTSLNVLRLHWPPPTNALQQSTRLSSMSFGPLRVATVDNR